MFFFEFCEVFQDSIFAEVLRLTASQILNVILVFVINFVYEIHVSFRVQVCPFHPLTVSCYQPMLLIFQKSLFGTLFSKTFGESAVAFDAFFLSRIKEIQTKQYNIF